jgi:hypothetical protein
MKCLVVIGGILAMMATSSMARHHHVTHKGLQANHYVSPLGAGTYGSGSSDLDASDQMSNQQILDTITNLITQAPTADIIKFLTALNSAEGQKVLRHAKPYDPTVISTVLKQLNGSPSDVAAGKRSLISLAASFQQYKGMHAPNLRKMYKVYITYQNVQAAKQMIQSAPKDVLKQGLTALAAAQQTKNFGNINFADLLNILNNNNEQGQKQVIDALLQWVDTTNCKYLKRAGQVYTAAVISARAPGGMPNLNLTTLAPPVYNQTTSGPSFNVSTTVPMYNQTSTTFPMFNRTSTLPMYNQTSTLPVYNQTSTLPVYNLTSTTSHPGQNISSPAPLVLPRPPAFNSSAQSLGMKTAVQRRKN